MTRIRRLTVLRQEPVFSRFLALDTSLRYDSNYVPRSRLHVGHEHPADRVPEDPAQPLDLAALPEVLRPKRVAELMGMDSEARPWQRSAGRAQVTSIRKARGETLTFNCIQLD